VLKERTTYEIMDPRELGIPESKLVLGKHSGRHAFRERVTHLGFDLDEQAIDQAFAQFKALADKKKSVYDEDIEAILDQQMQSGRSLWELERLTVVSGTGMMSMATVVLRDSAGVQKMDAATGDGPIDAVYSVLQRITGVSLELLDYQTRAVTEGKDAQGEANIQVRHGDRTVRGRGVSTDVIEAAARAYLSAINRIRGTESRGAKMREAGQNLAQP
jgi:2-isopropylmalate synthase